MVAAAPYWHNAGLLALIRVFVIAWLPWAAAQSVDQPPAALQDTKRTNFASVDCAAAIMAHSPGYKGAHHILSGSKETYMISECSAASKSVVIKLCQDILVDTVAIANHEYFSAMFKDVQISISDHYPISESEWTEVGTFASENARAEHTFALSAPKLWASFLKVDFLTHWSDEIYCPISTISVYGTTMMDKYKQQSKEQAPIPAEAAEPLVQESAAFENSICVDYDASWVSQAAPAVANDHASTQSYCPAAGPIPVLGRAESAPQDDKTCKIPRQPSSPLEIRMCPIRSVHVASPAVQVQAVEPYKESIYDNIMKRIAMLETTSVVLKTLFDGSIITQADALHQLFSTLNQTILTDIAELASENAILSDALKDLSGQVSFHRKSLYVQALVIAGLVVLVLVRILPQPVPGSFAAPSTPPTLVPQTPKRRQYIWATKYTNTNVTPNLNAGGPPDPAYESPNDTYSPPPSLFSPSRPSTPLSSSE